jgi:tetratricopeptide (TPR) repeat protein
MESSFKTAQHFHYSPATPTLSVRELTGLRQISHHIITCLLLINGGVLVMTSSSSATPNTAEKVQSNPRSLELNEEGVKAAQSGNTSKAEIFFKKALAADERNVTTVYNLAGMYLQNQKNDLAIQLLTEYHKKIPTDPGIAIRLGDAWFVKKNLPKAKEYYTKTFAINKNLPGLPQKLATLALLEKDLVTAESMLERAIQQQPRDLGLLENLSSIYVATKKPQKAVSTAQQALKAGATSSEIYLTLGSAYEALGQLDNALSAYERAAKLGSNDEELADRIEKLKEIIQSKAQK